MWVPTWLPIAMASAAELLPVGPDVVAVLLGQAEEERRMRGIVRHPGEIWLRQVVDPRLGKLIPECVHQNV